MFCETEAEAFTGPARELISQVARAYLERQAITTMDLVFDPAQHRLLLDDGSRFQEFLQRIALLQGRHTKRPVNERMRELTALAEKAMQRVAALAPRVPAVTDTGQAIARGLFADATLDEHVQAGIVFSRLLSRDQDWTARAMICLEMLEVELPDASRVMADQVLAEMLRLKPAAEILFGEADRRAMIEVCLSLAGAETQTELPPVLARLRAHGDLARLPHVQAALRERLAEMLGGSLPLFHADPQEEWSALLTLKQRIGALPLLAGDDIAANLQRRLGRFASPDLLNPILNRQPDIARKLLFLLRLYREITDDNGRFELLSLLGHYLEHRDFTTQFIGRQVTREDFASLAADISGAFVEADIPQPRKTRYLAVFRDQLAKVIKPAGQRLNQRGFGGPNDLVEVDGVKFPLRNWSPVGLLFGPCPSGIVVGDRLPISVMIRNSALSLEFAARAVVLRITDDIIAARYTTDDQHVMERIRTYFES